MNRKLLFLPIFVLSLFFISSVSQADVEIVQMTGNSRSDPGFTSSIVEIGPGDGDYDLIVCGIETDGANPFELPTPGSWDELDNGTCVGPLCQMGIWGRENLDPSSEDINCNWQDGTRGFAAGSIRYRGVDTDNPIIDMACSEFDGQDLVIDSVSSEPGAQIVLLNTVVTTGSESGQNITFTPESGQITIVRVFDDNRIIFLIASSALDPTGQGFEGGPVFIPPVDIWEVRQCVLSLRMATRMVPTMSEWGLISFAAFAGIAGIWYMKRRRVNA